MYINYIVKNGLFEVFDTYCQFNNFSQCYCIELTGRFKNNYQVPNRQIEHIKIIHKRRIYPMIKKKILASPPINTTNPNFTFKCAGTHLILPVGYWHSPFFFLCFFFKRSYLCIYFKYRDISFICSVTPQMDTTARSGPGQSQNPGSQPMQTVK